MTMLVRQGSTWRTITGGSVFASGGWRQLAGIKVFASGAWRTVATFSSGGSGGGGGGGGGGGSPPSMTLSLSPSAIGGAGAGSTITTNSVTATPSGGFAPYNYAWAVVTGDIDATFTINSPSVATTNVQARPVPTGTTVTCSIACTATDSLGTTATSDPEPCTFTRSGIAP